MSKKVWTKMSPIVRAITLFDVEYRLHDSKNGDYYNEEYFKGLLSMSAKISQMRDGSIKAIILFMWLSAVFINGSDFKLPGVEIMLSDIPHSISVFSLISSVAYLFFVIYHISDQGYRALIDGYIKRKAFGGFLDFETMRASSAAELLFLRIFRKNFFIGDDSVGLKPGFLASFFNFIIYSLSSIIMLVLIYFCASYIAYVTYFYVDSNYFGLFVKTINLSCLSIGVIAFMVASIPMWYYDVVPEEHEVGPSPTPSTPSGLHSQVEQLEPPAAPARPAGPASSG